jgi:membrane protein DedA with SNARE-associated domain
VIAYGQPFFDKHGPKAVFLGRFVSGLRITAAWLAGVNRMRWRDFLFWNATGGIVWAAAVGLLAYSFGHAAEQAIKTAGLVGLAAAVLALLAAWLYFHRRNKRPDVAGDDGALIAEAQDALEAEAEAR